MKRSLKEKKNLSSLLILNIKTFFSWLQYQNLVNKKGPAECVWIPSQFHSMISSLP